MQRRQVSEIYALWSKGSLVFCLMFALNLAGQNWVVSLGAGKYGWFTFILSFVWRYLNPSIITSWIFFFFSYFTIWFFAFLPSKFYQFLNFKSQLKQTIGRATGVGRIVWKEQTNWHFKKCWSIFMLTDQSNSIFNLF